MLRNMVSSLLEHEQITTTVAKAKEAQRLVEQVIGWGKKGGKSNWDRANSYLLVRLRSCAPAPARTRAPEQPSLTRTCARAEPDRDPPTTLHHLRRPVRGSRRRLHAHAPRGPPSG